MSSVSLIMNESRLERFHKIVTPVILEALISRSVRLMICFVPCVDVAAECTTLKSICAFTASLSAVRRDVPIRARAALQGAWDCAVFGICAAGVILKPSLKKIMPCKPKIIYFTC